jgi:uncharacterized membrane protein
VPAKPVLYALLAAGLLLTSAAWSRSAEYDEQYTLFLTGRMTRPDWPADSLTVADVLALQASQAGFVHIARDLRSTDVHPPLYFWMIAIWRDLFGDSLFAARLASVLFSIATLSLVAVLARLCGIPPPAAVLLTVGCYGFVYTGVIARGFALGQLLSIAGIVVLMIHREHRWPALAGGTLLGAATFTNYLTIFVGSAAMLWLAGKACVARGWPMKQRFGLAFLGFVAWLPADLWFFLAQRHSRTEQFQPFGLATAIARLGQYAAGNLFGGLSLYVSETFDEPVAAALACLAVGSVAAIVWRWRSIASAETRWLLASAAIAPPVGLLVLGLVFDNTPIELRYLAFATPFLGLLLAAALPCWLRHVVLAVQAVALAGLMTRPETMQPARATAAAAAALAGNGVVLLPRGNDGVGIIGAFATEAPAAMRLLVIDRDASPEAIRERTAGFSRVLLALLGQDEASRSTVPLLRRAFADRCWRNAGAGFNVLAFERICPLE